MGLVLDATCTVQAANPHRENWTNGRIVAMIFAGLTGLVGLALIAAGVVAIGAHLFARDDDGYYTSDRESLQSATYAIRTEEIDLGADEVDWAPEEVLGKVRIRVTGERPVFVGIGPDGDVAAYLRGVAQGELEDFDADTADVRETPGGKPRRPPGSQGFWVAQASGPGEQVLTWDADFGRWSAVVMNPDGSRGIDVEADAGVRIGWLIWVGLGLLIVGLILDGTAIALTLLITRRAGRDPPPATSPAAGVPPAGTPGA